MHLRLIIIWNWWHHIVYSLEIAKVEYRSVSYGVSFASILDKLYHIITWVSCTMFPNVAVVQLLSVGSMVLHPKHATVWEHSHSDRTYSVSCKMGKLFSHAMFFLAEKKIMRAMGFQAWKYHSVSLHGLTHHPQFNFNHQYIGDSHNVSTYLQGLLSQTVTIKTLKTSLLVLVTICA